MINNYVFIRRIFIDYLSAFILLRKLFNDMTLYLNKSILFVKLEITNKNIYELFKEHMVKCVLRVHILNCE